VRGVEDLTHRKIVVIITCIVVVFLLLIFLPIFASKYV
jgi:uncharacterized membrane protein YqiK